MKPTLSVYFLSSLADPEELAGGTAVVIDVLRATTTIVYALAAGATAVIPCLEVADAVAMAEQLGADNVLLGGERHGVAIEGFQLGNSPEDYAADRVGGKMILFTTTNGTRALNHARIAHEVFVVAFVNASAVLKRLFDRQHIHILCAGTNGRISQDDVLLAGLLVERIERQGGLVYQKNAQAIAARELWLSSFTRPQSLGAEPIEPERLAAELQKSLGGQNLMALGCRHDILAAARIDRFDIVPRMDPETMRITGQMTKSE